MYTKSQRNQTKSVKRELLFRNVSDFILFSVTMAILFIETENIYKDLYTVSLRANKN